MAAETDSRELDSRYCDCPTHGPRQRAYIVCNHILEKKDRSLIAHIKPWEDKPNGSGELCCAKPGEEHTVDELSLMCELTLLEVGLLLPGETRLQ